jgi:hypothetical protein
MGRDPFCPPAPDHRGDPGAVLYETQKVVTVELMRRLPGYFHRLVNALSTASAILQSTKSFSREQTPTGNMESTLLSVRKTLDRCCVLLWGVGVDTLVDRRDLLQFDITR